ncbi:MAG: sigma-54-dependent Fis family transcriptional regulator [Gammaproteobacteria bacterium]|nr:sigma-54-dependent Fis family transcriptional regulator [Gammaproteobacteria bacterium]MBQ0838904.1 sigma-54-dependent Fis family transcriptional regulator [Gammaproteobacteria bacterium]
MRKIALFAQADINEILVDQVLGLLSQWQVERFGEWDGIRENYSEYLLGIFLVSDDVINDPALLDKFESQLCKVSEIDWVAVVTAKQLDSPAHKDLLARYAVDYISLPIMSSKQSLLAVFGHLYGMAELRRRTYQSDHLICEKIVGNCPAMKEIYRLIPKLAATDAPILISGKSGTGKELIAQTLHQQSARAAQPFVVVNCGAIPENLVESELFGYVKGAFTGADGNKVGKIELAQKGTLFLDEIGDLPLTQQVKILRFLQEGTINPVGLAEARHVDVRVIAASHINLEEGIAKGTFRPDLFYRLNVLQIHSPALVERSGDIELLARHFLKKYRNEGLGVVKGFSKEAMDALKSHTWPGNIRELMNRIRKAAVLSESNLVLASDLGLLPCDIPKQAGVRNLAEARDLAEKLTVVDTLAANNHNVSKAAKQLGVSRMTLYRLLGKHKIEPASSNTATI